MRQAIILSLVTVLALLPACSMSSKATNYSGLADMHGPNPTHINTTNWALHLFLSKPLVGDATLDQTVADFTSEAKKAGATKVRIVQSDEWKLWWILPPFSFIVTPVRGIVAGDAIP